jgi:hypothetical protein
MGRAKNALIIVGAKRDGALKYYPLIDLHPNGGNDLGHGCAELNGFLLEMLQVLLEPIRRDFRRDCS